MTRLDVEFSDNSDAFKRRVLKMMPELEVAARAGLVEMTETWVTQMKSGRFTGYRPGRSQRKLRVRTGALRNSVGGLVSGKKLDALKTTLRVGGGRAGYARIQEYGGRVKGNDWLTIPVAAALTPAGAVRKKAKPRLEGTTKPRGSHPGGRKIYTTGFGRTAVVQGPRGPVIIARQPGKGRRKGSKKQAVLLFLLRRSVKVPPRLGARKQLRVLVNKQMPEMSREFTRILSMSPGTGKGV